MHFVLQTPSLQHLAGVRIVAHLCTQPDIFTQIAQSYNRPLAPSGGRKYYWQTVEDIVKRKVSQLIPLPQPCIQLLFDVVAPLAIQFIEWCRYTYYEQNNSFQLLDILLPQRVCWSMHGTVDYQRTAELMVRDDRMSIERRYEIACVSCLENEARHLFQLLSEERGREYVTGERFENVKLSEVHRFIVFYTRAINGVEDVDVPSMLVVPGDMLNSGSINKYLFEHAALFSGNRAMCEYLYQTLNPEEKEGILDDCGRLIGNCSQLSTSNLLFYLSLMNDELDRRYMLRENLADLLICLLGWPMQSLFVEAVEYGWDYVDERALGAVLRAIARNISLGFRDYDYSKVLLEVWQSSPVEYTRRLLDDVRFLANLFGAKREAFVGLILNEASSQQILALCNRYREIERILMDESAITDAALMEFKAIAALISSNDEEDEEKLLRSQYLTRLIDLAMESRMERRSAAL